MHQIRSSDNWKSSRPYSAGVVAGGLVFLSGHVPVDPAGGVSSTDVGEQTRVVLENLGRTLAEADLGPESIVSTNVYLIDMGQIDAVDAAYREFFGAEGPFPSRTTVEISSLGRAEFGVEISAIATAATQR